MTSVCPAFNSFLCPGTPETIENNPSPSTAPEENTVCFGGANHLEQKLMSSARQEKLTWCLTMFRSKVAEPTAGPSEWRRTLVQLPPSMALVMPALPHKASPSSSHCQGWITKGKYQGWRQYRHAAHCIEPTQTNNSINYSTRPLLPTVNLHEQ